MGFFKKIGDSMSGAMQPPTPEQVAAQQRAMGIDTADLGGPSNTPVADDDPIWEPVEGITLQGVAKRALHYILAREKDLGAPKGQATKGAANPAAAKAADIVCACCNSS